MMRTLVLVACLGVASSCQTYDFERVVPIAVAQTTDKTIVKNARLKPNLMLLIDNSGSMNFPIDFGDSRCPSGCGTSTTPCPSNCPTRTSQLKSVMNNFLSNSGTVGRMGMAVFPIVGDQCGASNDITVPLPDPTADDKGTDSSLNAKAQAINAAIQALKPSGGTPTGGSLEFVGAVGGLNDNADFRPDYVLLLTDGLPNCNTNNPNQLCACNGPNNNGCSASQVNACSCTGSCVGTNASTNGCAKGCLDQDGAVQAVRNLKLKGIQTIVVGFGADTAAGSAPIVLKAMASEGGFVRKCPNGTNAECGSNNTCTAKVCTSSVFQATNGEQLAAALAEISQSLGQDACIYDLSAKPSDPAYLSVLVDGQTVAQGADTYSYDYSANTVTFLGGTCSKLRASSDQKPVSVEFRMVQRL